MNTSAIVLAGGQSKRMGNDKALLMVGADTFIGIIVRKLFAVTKDVLIVGRDSDRYQPTLASFPVRFIKDSFDDCGPLCGLHAGLQAMQHPVGIAVACDAPLLNTALLQHMASLLTDDYDAVVPHDSGWHPLHAVYSKRCLSPIEAMIQAGDLRVQNLIKHIRTRVVNADEVAVFDPQQLSLKNINTPEDYEAMCDAPCDAP